MAAPPSRQNISTESAFSEYLPLIRATDGLTLSQVCLMTSLETSTIQNWIKRGFVPHPVAKKYRERHIARILLIASLRDCLQIDRIGALMTYINGNADDEQDDIISEVDLYDAFEKAVASVEDIRPTEEETGKRIERILDAYMAPSPERERLKGALTIMVIACIAGKYKQEAERLYTELSKEDNNG